eukprot:4169977-Pyramimonas_sp.AAC.1
MELHVSRWLAAMPATVVRFRIIFLRGALRCFRRALEASRCARGSEQVMGEAPGNRGRHARNPDNLYIWGPGL